MRCLLAVSLVFAAIPALADDTSGTVLAFDRVARVIVMDDKTIWELSDQTVVPEDLVAGDAVTITFTTAGDSGVGKIIEIARTGG